MAKNNISRELLPYVSLLLLIVTLLILLLPAGFLLAGTYLIPLYIEWSNQSDGLMITAYYLQNLLMVSAFISPIIFLVVGVPLVVILMWLYLRNPGRDNLKKKLRLLVLGFIGISLITLLVLGFLWKEPINFYLAYSSGCLSPSATGFEKILPSDFALYESGEFLIMVENSLDVNITLSDVDVILDKDIRCDSKSEMPVDIGPKKRITVNLSCATGDRYGLGDCVKSEVDLKYRTQGVEQHSKGEIVVFVESGS